MISRVTPQDNNDNDAIVGKEFESEGYKYRLLGIGHHLYSNDTDCNGQIPSNTNVFLAKLFNDCNIAPIVTTSTDVSISDLMQLGKDNWWRCGKDQLAVDVIDEASHIQGCLKAFMGRQKQDPQPNGAAGNLPEIGMLGLAGAVCVFMAI